MKTVALFGGSFNPPHEGHFEMAKYLYETLDVDEVWFLFSKNWQKDASKYEATEDRIAMGNIWAKHYPDMPFVMSDIQDKLGTDITYNVLNALGKENPDTKFIWTMGADSLANFHTWEGFDGIIENFPIAVLDRPGYTEDAKKSSAALTYPHLARSNPQDLTTEENGWCFLNNPLFDLSSSKLLTQLRAGKTQFDGPLQELADHILERGLYAIDLSNDDELDRTLRNDYE